MELESVNFMKTDFIIIGKSVGDDNVLAYHNVVDEQIQAETPFTKKSAKAIFSLFSNYNFEPKYFEKYIPKNVLIAESTPTTLKVLFSVEPQRKKITYGKNRELNTDVYNVPRLVFYYNNGTKKVFATLDKNINEDTNLYYAPFFNIYDSGSICFGNVDFKILDKIKTFDGVMQYITNAFFNSVFTHSNNLITAKYIMQTQNIKRWNKNNLIDKKLTIKDIL